MTFGASTSATLPNIATTPSITNNIVNGAMQATMNSSSLFFSTNIVNAGSFIIANNHFTTAGGAGNLSVANNLVGGTQISNLTVQGANQGGTTNNPSFNGNLMYGLTNAAHINADNSRISGANTYTALNATAILGGNLAVTGSSLGSDTATVGSAFVGRFNANDGIRNKTSEIVFAVGTGTATGTRKTGFLIDSGSNTFVEGTLNVSGSTTITGSLVLSSSAAVELNIIGNAVITGSLILSSSATTELQVIGGSEITGSFGVLGSTFVSGSVRGNVAIPSISSNTASLDFGSANFFEVTLVSSVDTRIIAQNVRPGQTINLKVSQPGVGTGTISFPSTFKFPEVAPYTASLLSNSVDVVTFITFEDTGSIYSVAVKRLV